jgi:hypothetical protein
MADLVRPDDLKRISNDADMAKAQEYLKRAKKQEEEQKACARLFLIGISIPRCENASTPPCAEQPSRVATNFR